MPSMIETVSQMNWPAARVRNTIQQYVDARRLQYMPVDAPAKRIVREAGLAWLAATAGVDVDDIKLMDPVTFVQQYVLGSREQYTYDRAFKMVHGTASFRYVRRDVASERLIEMARAELAAVAAAAAAAASFSYVPRDVAASDDPEVREAAAVLVGMAEAEAEAPVEAPAEAPVEAPLAFLSDRLVAVEIRMGLPVQAAPGTRPMDMLGRMLAIMTKIVEMDE